MGPRALDIKDIFGVSVSEERFTQLAVHFVRQQLATPEDFALGLAAEMLGRYDSTAEKAREEALASRGGAQGTACRCGNCQAGRGHERR